MTITSRSSSATSSRELLSAVALDLTLGDPHWLPHPVRAIGWLAAKSETFWRSTGLPLRTAGAFFWCTVVGATVAVVRLTLPRANVYWIYSLLAARDLDIQAARVISAVQRNDLISARQNLSLIVGRDTAALDEPEIVRATVETVAENLSDGVIAPLFYLALAGPLGMAAYKAINTLDSTVGYRNARYRDFGWASAKLDDLANFIPARLTALLIWISSLLPGFDAGRSMQTTQRDGASQPSPNAGYPEAAVAGALGVQLGGTNYYRGVRSEKPKLGENIKPLDRSVFGRVRLLLYASEAICVACIVWTKCR